MNPPALHPLMPQARRELQNCSVMHLCHVCLGTGDLELKLGRWDFHVPCSVWQCFNCCPVVTAQKLIQIHVNGDVGSQLDLVSGTQIPAQKSMRQWDGGSSPSPGWDLIHTKISAPFGRTIPNSAIFFNYWGLISHWAMITDQDLHPQVMSDGRWDG